VAKHLGYQVLSITLLCKCHSELLAPGSLTCPPNSSYSLCVSSCPETCLGVVGPPGCEEVCVEGCECNPGFILSDDKCNPWFASKCIFIILIFIFV
uniref:TIL domain-containing protein n=1 Tax=Maylandia zebra TaxID=106582 RepID=A0A3P9DU43_9CICH